MSYRRRLAIIIIVLSDFLQFICFWSNDSIFHWSQYSILIECINQKESKNVFLCFTSQTMRNNNLVRIRTIEYVTNCKNYFNQSTDNMIQLFKAELQKSCEKTRSRTENEKKKM